jgi:aldehyde dehydrogenase (NAD+)
MKSPHQRAEQIIHALHARIPLLYIGGLGVESEGNATIQVPSPIDGVAIGRIAAANDRDVERAIRAARHAGEEGWSDAPPSERSAILWRAADLLEQEAIDFAILETLETGKTLRESSTYDVQSAIAALRYYAGWASKRAGEVHDLGGGFVGLSQIEPHPVVAVILSWASPLLSAAWKIAPALAAGCSVVLKPSERTPFGAIRLAELFAKAGLPQGALNVITGFGHQAGESLAMSHGASVLSFSGSIDTARRVVLASAKSNLKKVHLSLGGKSANILFDDASLKRALAACWKAIFTGRGEAPTAGSRLIVHESIYDDAVTIITERAREIIVGNPFDEHTELGPLISEEHLKRVLAYVELGRREGARLVAGGTRDVEGAKATGWFMRPTVFMDVTPTMRIAREEISGPVLSVLKFKTEDEAIEIANGTDYGLAAAVWTRDLGRAHRAARKLRAGVVWINHYDHLDPSLPFGGSGLSGHGRDLGRAGLEQFCQPKAIYLPTR